MTGKRLGPIALMAAAFLPPGCGGPSPAPPTLTLATTTSTRDSGLLDALLPLFRRRAGVEVKVVAVGSGQALQLGRRGDADAILSHAPEAEERFLAEGHGESRRPVMHNDFLLVGPSGGPGGVRAARGIPEALGAIASGGLTFISRGDDSGTHQKELRLWKAAGIEPGGPWYVRAGSGMAQVLRMADEKRAWTLSDRATFLSQRSQLDLAILDRADPLLENPYHILVVDPRRHPGVHAREARLFADFLRGEEARSAIASFGIDRLGERLFVPEPPGDRP